jgi:AmiR/NasT family two-component response regulator
LPDPTWTDTDSAGRTTADIDHEHVVRARQVVQARYGLDPARAYHHLTQLSRKQRRGVNAIARDILAGAVPGAEG